MPPPLAAEIYNKIFWHLVDDGCLNYRLDEGISPFNENLPPYPTERGTLATSCALVSKRIYAVVMPIVWRYFTVRSKESLESIIDQVHDGIHRRSNQSIKTYPIRVDFRAWRKVDIGRSMVLLKNLANVQILAIECRLHPGPLWRNPSYGAFMEALPTLCPHLKRLQLLDPREAPRLSEIAGISRGCKELRSLQLVHLTCGPDHPHESFEGDETGSEYSYDSDETVDFEGGWEAEREVVVEELEEVAGHESEEVASTIPTIREGHSDWDDEDRHEKPITAEGLFGFFELEHLSLGMGDIHSVISEQDSIGQFIKELAPYRSSMTKLRQIDVNVPLEAIDVRTSLATFGRLVKSSVLHMLCQTHPQMVYASSLDIRKLSVVAFTAYVSIPSRMAGLEELNVLLRRPLVDHRSSAGPAVSRPVLDAARVILGILLKGGYPALKRVTLWRGAFLLDPGINSLVEEYHGRFARMGVHLASRIRTASVGHGVLNLQGHEVSELVI